MASRVRRNVAHPLPSLFFDWLFVCYWRSSPLRLVLKINLFGKSLTLSLCREDKGTYEWVPARVYFYSYVLQKSTIFFKRDGVNDQYLVLQTECLTGKKVHSFKLISNNFRNLSEVFCISLKLLAQNCSCKP